MKDSTKKAIIEGFKDFVRVEALAIIPVLTLSLQAPDVTVRLIVLQTVVAALKGGEKFLHKIDSKLTLPV